MFTCIFVKSKRQEEYSEFVLTSQVRNKAKTVHGETTEWMTFQPLNSPGANSILYRGAIIPRMCYICPLKLLNASAYERYYRCYTVKN